MIVVILEVVNATTTSPAATTTIIEVTIVDGMNHPDGIGELNCILERVVSYKSYLGTETTTIAGIGDTIAVTSLPYLQRQVSILSR